MAALISGPAFKVFFDYLVSSRSAWVTGDPVSIKQSIGILSLQERFRFSTFFWHPGWGHIPLQLQCLFLNSYSYWESFEAWLFRDQARFPRSPQSPSYTVGQWAVWAILSLGFQLSAWSPSKNSKEITDLQLPRMGSRASTYHCFYHNALKCFYSKELV